MSDFKPGEIVYLVVGSPAMVVKEFADIDGDPNECIVLCHWFEGIKLFEQEFGAEELTRKNPNIIPPHTVFVQR